MHHWDTQLHAGIIQQVTRWEVVSTINDDVIARDDVHDVFGGKASVVRNDFDVGVEQVDGLLRRINFAITNAIDVVQNLTLQVAGINIIHVDNADRSHTSGGKIQRCG